MDEIVGINTDARPFTFQIALCIPILASIVGPVVSFLIMKIPTPSSRAMAMASSLVDLRLQREFQRPLELALARVPDQNNSLAGVPDFAYVSNIAVNHPQRVRSAISPCGQLIVIWLAQRWSGRAL